MNEWSSEVLPGLIYALVLLMQIRFWHMRLSLLSVIADLRKELRERSLGELSTEEERP